MKIAAVIAEYNPFHNGHAYQLQRIKDHYGYDFVIVAMSGDFTQRGEPAIADKYARAQMALLSGADLVIELPAYYACASAEYFATGAVSLLHGLGCVDALFFGSESEDTDSASPNPPALLLHAASILLEEPDSYRSALSDSLKRGKSYAAARMDALMTALNPTPAIQPASHLSTVLSLPNNTLGIEYCKAILRMNIPLKPFAIKRIGGGYHDVDPTDTYASAEAIRTLLLGHPDRNADSLKKASSSAPSAQDILSANNALSALVPSDTAQMLAGLSRDNRLLTQNDFSELLHYQLLLHESELERYADCTPELANRIRSLLPSLLTKTTTDMIETIKTKAYTYTRINRVLTHLLLDMTSDTLSALTDKSAPAFLTHARILGFRKEACGSLLSAVKESARIPLITKPADYHPTGAAKALYEADLLASHIYQSVAAKKSAQAFRHELTRSPLIV
ncbi:MAG: nucleotidyltransferase family protein [Lachnospiraceae bacterium]|nr:nucleotidyltransferase family protein [Lachnospiraceae bacterium]